MLSNIGKVILEFIWGKVILGLSSFLKKLLEEKKIDQEVSREEDEIELIKKEIKAFRDKNPNAEEIPKDFEDRLRAAVLKRNRGLSKL